MDFDRLILDELTRHFGAPPERIWNDPKPGPAVGCAFFSAAKTGRPAGTMATFGMSRKRMVLDSRAVETDTHRAELVAYLDERELGADDLAEWMRWVGAFPFTQTPPTFLGWGHTIPTGRSLFMGSHLTTPLTLSPIVRPDQGTVFTLEGDPVSLLWLTFLTDAEYQFKRQRGENAILDLFDSHDHPIELARQRSSYL